MSETLDQYGKRMADDAAAHAALLAEPLTEVEEGRVQAGQQQLWPVGLGVLEGWAQVFARPLERVDVLRAEAVRRELAARAGTTVDQVARYVEGSRVLSLSRQTAVGFTVYTLQVRNRRYPGTEHSAGLHYSSRRDEWTNASGMVIPADRVLAYLRAYEEKPLNPLALHASITRR